MKILIVGDSITEGVPGVSYVDMLKQKLPDHTIINYGKGGDTVGSALKRCRSIEFPEQLDVIVLFIGVNDVFGNMTKPHKLFKVITRQTPAKNMDEFTTNYQQLLEFLRSKTKKIVVIPPLLLGEDIDNKWNQEIAGFVQQIEWLVSRMENCDYVDVRYQFILALRDKKVSPYLPVSLRTIIRDVQQLKTPELVDNQARLRGLHVTLDGVHLNSNGAFIVMDSLLHYILEHA